MPLRRGFFKSKFFPHFLTSFKIKSDVALYIPSQSFADSQARQLLSRCVLSLLQAATR